MVTASAQHTRSPRSIPVPVPARPDLRSLTAEGLVELLGELGEPRYRADQVFHWLHSRCARSFDEMTSLPKALRAVLAERATIGGLELLGRARSSDGTTKLLLQTSDGQRIESVLIPTEDRLTQCISSQVGCRIGCTFCLTATMPIRRSLLPSEIVDQVYHARRILGAEGARLTNLVYMGMGEPLDNFDGVVQSARIVMHPKGMALGARRITVSTSGLVPRMGELLDALPVKLALSLNASDDATRDRLIPINRKYPIASLFGLIESRPAWDWPRMTVEYVLLRGVNDRPDDAARLCALLRRTRLTVNLIPFNPYPGALYQRPDDARVDAFAATLSAARIPVTVRRPRGEDIGAACGMLDGQ